ncbi:hypothetical protein CLOP_g21130 [Closterium sp. NIES-67]|nr:hypothetical protein CLOP_g21130 [Closterium sp. NIES-67]
MLFSSLQSHQPPRLRQWWWEGGGVNSWSEWRMRLWKKPVLRGGDTLMFKWWGSPNDVVASITKSQFGTCNFTGWIMLHSTTWVGRYKLVLPSGANWVFFRQQLENKVP